MSPNAKRIEAIRKNIYLIIQKFKSYENFNLHPCRGLFLFVCILQLRIEDIYIYIIRILTKFEINSQAAYEPIKRSSHNVVQVFFCFFFFGSNFC